MAEAVMMGLAPKIGRNHAHELVYAAAGQAIDSKISLKQALLNNEEVMNNLTLNDIDFLLDPSHYTGTAGAMIDSVLRKVQQ